MKKIIIISLASLLLLGVGGVAYAHYCEEPLMSLFGTSLTKEEKIEKIKTDIKAEQKEWKKTHDKYKSEKNEEYFTVNYTTPDGEEGYQIIIYDEQGRIIESVGFGVEADWRTWTKEYISNTPSST